MTRWKELAREIAGVVLFVGALAFAVWSTITDIQHARKGPHLGDSCGSGYHWVDVAVSPLDPIDLSCEPDR